MVPASPLERASDFFYSVFHKMTPDLESIKVWRERVRIEHTKHCFRSTSTVLKTAGLTRDPTAPNI